jgi:hypothetical protein
MEPTQAEDKGSFIPLFAIILGLFLWLGYQRYVSSQGTADAVATITSCATPDSRYQTMIGYEFKVADSTYTGHYKTFCSFCNCDGKPTCIGQKYPVVYAIKDPTINGIDVNHPLNQQIANASTSPTKGDELKSKQVSE